MYRTDSTARYMHRWILKLVTPRDLPSFSSTILSMLYKLSTTSMVQCFKAGYYMYCLLLQNVILYLKTSQFPDCH